MARTPTSPRQRRTTARVMHEFKHGELKRGPAGRSGRVKSRRQAIAIALKEAGASKYESKAENRRNLSKTKKKEERAKTAQQRKEGKSPVGTGSRSHTRSHRADTSKRSPGAAANRSIKGGKRRSARHHTP